jgi:hypothetical protein
MTTRRRRRDPYTRTVVRLPERDLAESILYLAAPLLEPLGPMPPVDEARGQIELAISLWNAHVLASKLWGAPKGGEDRLPLTQGYTARASFSPIAAQ